MKKIRTLSPNEIELRVADKNSKGQVHMLMYITSRGATNLLDETYGMENYNIEYVDVSGQIYCKLSVWDEENKRYVIRMDTGEEAKISADKSLASDALKRTIVRLGVTELYSGPAIYVDDDGYGNRGYKVTHIAYDDNRNIIELHISNRFGKEIYSWKENGKVTTTTTNTIQAPANNIDTLTAFCSRKKTEVGVDMDALKRFYTYYVQKAESWKGNFNVEQMWTNWMTPKPKVA